MNVAHEYFSYFLAFWLAIIVGLELFSQMQYGNTYDIGTWII